MAGRRNSLDLLRDHDDGYDGRRKYGFLVYLGGGWRSGCLLYLRRRPDIAVSFDQLDGYLLEHGLWDGTVVEVDSAELEYALGMTAPQRSIESGRNGSQVVADHFRGNGFRVLREIVRGRCLFRNPYKWDVVAFTDDVALYVEVKKIDVKGGGTAEEKLVKTLASIDSINLQHFDDILEARLLGGCDDS